MKNLILDAMKISVDLRHEQLKSPKDLADVIDRLTAALMISEETIRRFAKMLKMAEGDLDKILNIIETSDAKLLEKYSQK